MRGMHFPRHWHAVTALCAACAGQPSSAGDWRITPQLSLSELYSDNIFARATDEESDLVSSLSTGVSVTGRGSRVRLTSDYQLQNSWFLQNSDLNNMTHFLGSNLSTELVKQRFFVDVNASMFPTVTNNIGQITNRNTRNVGTNSNRADVISYAVSPRFTHRFGSWATFNASSSFSFTTTQSQDGDSNLGNFAGSGDGRNYNVSLSSGRQFARLSWNLSYSLRQFDNSSQSAVQNPAAVNQGSDLKSLSLSGSYRINRQFALNGNVADENNRFAGNQNLQRGNQGLSWSAGATWTPSPRTSISGSYGQRPFGATKNFSFSYRLRRIVLSGSYSEDLNTTADILQRQRVFQRTDVFGNPIFDPLGNADPELPLSTLSLTDDVFVSRSFNATIGYRRRLDRFSVSVFRNQQDSVRTLSEELATGTSFNWSRTMSRHLTGGLNVSYQDRSADILTSGALEAVFVTPFLSYTIGPHLSSRLSYSYSENIAEDPANGFVENAVTGTLSYAF